MQLAVAREDLRASRYSAEPAAIRIGVMRLAHEFAKAALGFFEHAGGGLTFTETGDVPAI
jgi:hypothetical protein